MPTVGPETYLEVLDNHLRRQRLTIDHCGGKNRDSGCPGENIVTVIFFLFFLFIFRLILFCCLFLYFLTFFFSISFWFRFVFV